MQNRGPLKKKPTIRLTATHDYTLEYDGQVERDYNSAADILRQALDSGQVSFSVQVLGDSE